MNIYKQNGGAMRLLLILSIFALSACHSGWQQDPFKGDPDNIQNAVPQGTKRPNVPPEIGAVFVDAKSNYSLKEGEEITIPTTSRVNPKLTFKRTDIVGLEDSLPGAVYDESKNIITYSAPIGAIEDGTLISHRIFTISVYTEFEGLTQVFSKEVSVSIIKGSAEKPVIEKLEGFAVKLKENQKADIKIFVRDKDSQQGPILAITGNGYGYQSAGPFIDHKIKGEAVPGSVGLWKFTGTIDLPYNKVDITTAHTQLQANFIAYSEFGVPSDVKDVYFEVYTTAAKPRFFTEAKLEFKKDQTNQYKFTVVDTKEEGKIEAIFKDSCSGLVGEHDCSCKNSGSLSTCSISWTPTELSEVNIALEATNTVNANTVMKDTNTATANIKIQVVE